MRKTVKFIVVPTALYHYDLYRWKFFFAVKIGRANVTLEESTVEIYAEEKWNKYKELIGDSVMNAHKLYKQILLRNKKETG